MYNVRACVLGPLAVRPSSLDFDRRQGGRRRTAFEGKTAVVGVLRTGFITLLLPVLQEAWLLEIKQQVNKPATSHMRTAILAVLYNHAICISRISESGCEAREAIESTVVVDGAGNLNSYRGACAIFKDGRAERITDNIPQ